MGKAGKDRIFQIDWSMHEKPGMGAGDQSFGFSGGRAMNPQSRGVEGTEASVPAEKGVGGEK